MPQISVKKPTTDGVALCARYAFGPNKLHLCGPDANREVLSYLNEGATDIGLAKILSGFSTLYPYLETIAHANGIKDPFDSRVVQAYWIGNPLLESVPKQTFFRHLTDKLRLPQQYKKSEFDALAAKLPKGARMHHSFHVFNAHKRTGHEPIYHTLSSMDSCRVSWGRIVRVDGPSIVLRRRPLRLNGQALALGEEEDYQITRRLEDFAFDDVKIGTWISIHWGVPCEVLSKEDIRALAFYTQKHIALANSTL